MSGLNPFRPRNSEDSTSHHHHSSSYSVPANSGFHAPSSSATALTNDPSNANGSLDTPPSAFTPADDDLESSDDQSDSDPFRQDSYVSDDDTGQEESGNSATISRMPPGEDARRLSANTAPQSVRHSLPASPTVTAPSAAQPPRPRSQERFSQQDNYYSFHDNTTTGSSNVSIRSLTPHGGTRNSSTSDVSQAPVHTNRFAVDRDSKPPASRAGNREKIPPPPPKSHHGKLISPSPATTPSSSQTAPVKSTNRFSFQGTPSESSSFSSKAPQIEVDYFTGLGGNQDDRPTEILRRSQSQHKRPPTPPLARRHSQMRRSKTTTSKNNMARLSMPPIKVESTSESPPPSPGSWSLNPSRTRDARLDTPSSEENASRPPLHLRVSGSKPSTPATETSDSTSPSHSRPPLAKRASQHNPLPPPPPPRRTRGPSNNSTDTNRPASVRSEKQAQENERFVPQPSNATDILADLTRLQKEVDDLRGHYESRKSSH